jgi:hypothetical protein
MYSLLNNTVYFNTTHVYNFSYNVRSVTVVKTANVSVLPSTDVQYAARVFVILFAP